LPEITQNENSCARKEIYTSQSEKITLNEAETFIITTSGGTSLSALLNAPALIEKIGGGNIPIKQAEDAVHKIRQVLRDKKS
jgi:hypothetical protein